MGLPVSGRVAGAAVELGKAADVTPVLALATKIGVGVAVTRTIELVGAGEVPLPGGTGAGHQPPAGVGRSQVFCWTQGGIGEHAIGFVGVGSVVPLPGGRGAGHQPPAGSAMSQIPCWTQGGIGEQVGFGVSVGAIGAGTFGGCVGVSPPAVPEPSKPAARDP
jgi:hypothetical protein